MDACGLGVIAEATVKSTAAWLAEDPGSTNKRCVVANGAGAELEADGKGLEADGKGLQAAGEELEAARALTSPTTRNTFSITQFTKKKGAHPTASASACSVTGS